MKHNADTIVSLFISCSMSELMHDPKALTVMTPKQRALLEAVCRTAAEDALALSGTGATAPANRPDKNPASIPVICIA